MRFVARPVVMAALLMVAVGPTGQCADRQPRGHRPAEPGLSASAGASGVAGSDGARAVGRRPPAYPSSPPPSYGGGNDLLPQLLTRVDALEEQVRQLRGRTDETQNQLQQMGQDLNKKIDDWRSRLIRRAAGVGARPPCRLHAVNSAWLASRPPPGRPATRQPRTPELALQEGNAALNRRDYPAAEAAAREVLDEPDVAARL